MRFWNSQWVRELVRANRQAKTRLYFFTTTDVHFRRKRVYGTYWNPKRRKWMRKAFPLPDVLYDRGGNKRSKVRTRLIRNTMRQMEIKTINPRITFNKWEMYNILKQNPEIAPHLPPTIYATSMQDIRQMLKDARVVYLKAFYGSRGTKVVRVAKTKKGYTFSYFRKRLVIRKKSNFKKVRRSIRSFFGKRRILAQHGIKLLRYKGNLVDLRAEATRNGNDEIEMAGVSVRVSRKKSPITTHASVYSFEAFFGKKMNYSEEQLEWLKSKIRRFVTQVYEAVEAEYGKFGEIGIDFGLDREGHIWFIECNARSAKVSLMKAYDGNEKKKSFVNLLEYAKLLAPKVKIRVKKARGKKRVLKKRRGPFRKRRSMHRRHTGRRVVRRYLAKRGRRRVRRRNLRRFRRKPVRSQTIHRARKPLGHRYRTPLKRNGRVFLAKKVRIPFRKNGRKRTFRRKRGV